MKITSLDIIAQTERLAEAFQWEPVSMELTRQPGGDYSFSVWLKGSDLGLDYECSTGDSPAEAVDRVIQRCKSSRDPEVARKKKIEELEAKIQKLHSVVLGLPPYRPNRELSNGEPAIRVNETVNV